MCTGFLSQAYKCKEINVRVFHTVRSKNLETLEDLVKKSVSDLKSSNFGDTSLRTLQTLLQSYGLKLGMSDKEIREYEASPPENILKFITNNNPKQKLIDDGAITQDLEEIARAIASRLSLDNSITSIEAFDTPSIIAGVGTPSDTLSATSCGEMLYPGTVVHFIDKGAARRFAEICKQTFKASGGEKDESYYAAVSYLKESQIGGKPSYPIYLSDAALQTLGKSDEALNRLSQVAETAKMVPPRL